LVEQLLEQMLYQIGHRASPSEQSAWRKSLPAFAIDLADADLGEVEMLVEYHLPLTSQRADVVLAGVHVETGQPSYVIVELKQWSCGFAFEGDPESCSRIIFPLNGHIGSTYRSTTPSACGSPMAMASPAGAATPAWATPVVGPHQQCHHHTQDRFEGTRRPVHPCSVHGPHHVVASDERDLAVAGG
jgi:hypothetical protein